MRSLLDEELSLVDFLLDQILLLKEIVAQKGGAVPSIVTELLRHKQVALPLGVAISGHPLPLNYSDRNVDNTFTFFGCKSSLCFARYRAQYAHLHPSLRHGRVKARRGSLKGRGEGKTKLPWVPRTVVHSRCSKQGDLRGRVHPSVKCFGGSSRLVVLISGRAMCHE
jgi:hypothetical protein